ncbi:class I SAM-dependent methyltransferase [Candidatus Pacearchaeota archaeon]|nr:class I SAM-dependent methyltransferase [Candidatus Pacearchaeota archaeon]
MSEKNGINELEDTYMNKNFVVSYFSKLKVDNAIKIADLKKEDIILDFGCGAGWLKNILKKRGYKTIGYDIVPEQSDVEDYTILSPDKIFAMDVFEHIPEQEIIKIVRNFKKMNPKFELITAIPTENWVSRKARKLLGKTERVNSHITPINRILNVLNSELKQVRKKSLFSVSYIAKFKSE